MSDRPSLDDILDSIPDEDVQVASRTSVGDRVASGFRDINKFIEETGHIPVESDDVELREKSLARRLASIISNESLRKSLLDIDVHGLLKAPDTSSAVEATEEITEPEQVMETSPAPSEPIIASEDEILPEDIPSSLDDIFDTIDLDTMEEETDGDIFNLKHVESHEHKILQPDFTSQRKPCTNFEKYKPLFDRVETELQQGLRKTVKFQNEQEILEGQYFILNGVYVYIEKVGKSFVKNDKKNARLKVIFSNETEGNNLLRSLATELYKDPNGRRITDPKAGTLFGNTATDEDVGTGTVYVLRSLSEDPAVKPNHKILHKIGVTTDSVKKRIANAQKEPTYLLAPVEVVAEFEVFNFKPRKLEMLLHRYFDSARAEISIKDRFGNPVKSREWFFVPPSVVKEAVDRLVDGSLTDTIYDSKLGKIMQKS